jgi:hemin uptake protein HemP
MKPLPLRGAIAGPAGSTAIATGNPPPRRQIRSVELFNGGREVLIEHAGELYSLRQTSKGKLILTK